jgi:hypothetical protein
MGVNIQSSGNFLKLVGEYEYPIIEYWIDRFTDAMKDNVIPEIFEEKDSDNPSEAVGELVGAPSFRQWAGEFTYADLKDGDVKLWTPVVFEAGLAYDRFLLSNAKLADMKLKVSQGKFALAAARHRLYCHANIFTYADQTSFTYNGATLPWTVTANGLALASSSQTSANYDTTQDNLHALELTEANLETLIQAMYDLKDADGNDANLEPDTLVVPTYLRKTAIEILGGPGKVDVADNNPNIYHGSMKLIVWKQYRKQSTKSGYPWFVMDSKAAKDSAKSINRLESGDEYEINSWKDEESQTWKLGSLMWYSAGVSDFRPFQFSIPD